MNTELQNDPEYLRSLLLVTRERLANALFTITELETLVAIERSKAANQNAATENSEDKK